MLREILLLVHHLLLSCAPMICLSAVRCRFKVSAGWTYNPIDWYRILKTFRHYWAYLLKPCPHAYHSTHLKNATLQVYFSLLLARQKALISNWNIGRLESPFKLLQRITLGKVVMKLIGDKHLSLCLMISPILLKTRYDRKCSDLFCEEGAIVFLLKVFHFKCSHFYSLQVLCLLLL